MASKPRSVLDQNRETLAAPGKTAAMPMMAMSDGRELARLRLRARPPADCAPESSVLPAQSSRWSSAIVVVWVRSAATCPSMKRPWVAWYSSLDRDERGARALAAIDALGRDPETADVQAFEGLANFLGRSPLGQQPLSFPPRTGRRTACGSPAPGGRAPTRAARFPRSERPHPGSAARSPRS